MFPGARGGNLFRGDWIDLVNDFYLTGIQELYHIGKGTVRTHVYNRIGGVHISNFVLVAPDGKTTEIPVVDCLPPSFPEWLVKGVRQYGHVMLEGTLIARFKAPVAGKYRLEIHGGIPARSTGALNVYVNRQRQLRVLGISFENQDDLSLEFDLGEITLRTGENTLSVDPGPIYARWSDGTVAVWETPSLGTGFSVTNGEVTFATDYDRMWPDTWSGQKKIYFFSWDGTSRAWKLPQDWASVKKATLYPLGPDGRGEAVPMTIGEDARLAPKLLPQVPYVLVPSDS